jgi:uncharacterized membrane protein SpoIIM required for sporulation
MKEIVFLNKNANSWNEFERTLFSENENIERLSELYINLTNDLSYAKTFYPNSKVTTYLNDLALKAHQKIYRTKKEKKGRIALFWKKDFPLAIYKTRKYLLYSFLITIISASIGWLSSANDDSFVRLILGDAYVNMTEMNIENGDPMAVYKKASESEMFLGITINNIQVSFFAFVFGIFFSLGTGYILFSNGIMLGAFHYLTFKNGVLLTSMSTIWLHGTIEIFSIIVAGSAGIIIGNSFMFPGTYNRIVSFKNGAKLGIKIVLGLIPFFIIAGFIEGFITRYSNMPIYLKFSIIGGSLLLIIWYFFIYPNKVVKSYTA